MPSKQQPQCTEAAAAVVSGIDDDVNFVSQGKPEAAHFEVMSGWQWLNVNKPAEYVCQLDLEMPVLSQAQLVARSFRPS